MKSLIHLGSAVLCGCVLAACASSGGLHPVPRRADVSSVQFSDIPVPAGMRLKDRFHESHSFQVGDFRYGDFHYYGSLPTAEVADYMARRMELHGWVLSQPPDLAMSRLELRFQRRPHIATCEIWREASETHLKIAVRTEVPK